MAEPIPRWVRRWWVRVPSGAARLSRGLAFSLADGHFLSAAPAAAAWFPPVAAAFGFAVGALTLGYERIFTEALWLAMVGAAVGFLATGPGVAFVAGLAAGDFLVGQRQWVIHGFGFGEVLEEGLLAGVLRIRLPMFIGYAILAALVVYLPRLARALIADIPKAERLPKEAAFGIAAVLNLVVVAIGVRLWADASAVLVRPVFTWQGAQPTVRAVATLQGQGRWVIATAVAATLARFVLLWWAYGEQERAARLALVEEAVAAGPGRKPWLERLGPVAGSIAAAAFLTFALSGVIESWWVAATLFVVFLTLRLLQRRVLPLRLDPWRRTAARIPVLLRLAVALLVVDTLRRAFVDEFDPTFNRLALYLAAAVIVLYLLLPGAPAQPAEAEEAPA